MSEQSTKKGTMVKDTIIYMLAKGIEGIVGVVTMSVMTYLFATGQMGNYSIVNIAITTVGMVCIQWLVQSVLRYINKYDLMGEEKLKSFYTTVFSAWLRVNVLVAVIALVLIGIIKVFFSQLQPVAAFLQVYSLELLVLGVMWFVTYNTAQLVIAMLAAIRRAKLNLLLSLITVCGKLGFMVLFCKLYGSKIEWIFLSYFITDGIVSIIGLLQLKIHKYINMKNSSSEILAELKSYGMPLMGNMLTTSVLNKSDIYIVTIFITASAAGIYQTNYSIVATAFTLLSASVMRGSYPTILRTWSEGKKELTQRLVGEAVRFYMLLAIPAVAGLGAVSDVMAAALFEQEYVQGHSVMFWVGLGMMFLGLTEYAIKPWELNGKTKSIFLRSLIGSGVNVGLNLIFVNIFKSYYVAAVTTFIAFFVYFCLAKLGTRKIMSWHLKPLTYIRIIGSAIVMYIAIYMVKSYMEISGIRGLIILVIFGMLIYGVSLAVSGEIKEEIKVIYNKVKR